MKEETEEAVRQVASLWEGAGQSDLAQTHIHPAGGQGQEAYEASGVDQARSVVEIMDVWGRTLEGSPRVADFGCGDGRVLQHLADTYDDLWGIDASEAMLSRLSERVPSAQPLLSNGIDGALEALEADLIFSYAVFIHHTHSGGAAILNGLTQGVVPGGLLALQIPCYSAPREGSSWIDVTVWTKDTLKNAAMMAGLQVVEMWDSPGEFSFENVGENHLQLQVFRKNT